ncbi:protein swallow [Drosophila eugracilis]|uniref:protein swallow n=1 Tax=Drosophila eugracilis TaxID=29029 RepID=UPI0007E7EBB8|nr:protein swallow [Drosophila eugracilis]
MSLQDESFPADELFDQLNNLSSLGSRNTWFSEHHQPAAFERNASPFLEICYADGDPDGDADVANKSAKTCVSDPVGREDEEDDDIDDGGDGQLSGEKAPLRNGRGSKSVSYQDIHSAYTKRRFKHVASKVGQYIAEMQSQDQKRRSASGSGFQRHSSMPEYLTPTSQRVNGHDSHFKMDDNSHSNSNCNSNPNSSCSYERLLAENESLQQDKDRLQAYNDYVQLRLDKKVADLLQVKRNFETLRTELSDCQQKLKRHQSHSLRSLNSWPPMGISKATQTEFSVATISSENALVTPHPLNNVTYNSSDGSIEMALLSVGPAVRIPQTLGQSKRVIHPQSLDFSSVSGEGDGHVTGEAPGSSSRALARRAPAPNNSESSQPSSNDSAIEVEGHEEERATSRQWSGHREGIYYFDKRNNRVIEVLGINLAQNQSQNTSQNQSINDSQAQLLVHSLAQSHVRFGSKRTTIGSRMLRFLGPCVRCRNNDPLNTSNSYTVGLPLMPEEEFTDPRNRR